MWPTFVRHWLDQGLILTNLYPLFVYPILTLYSPPHPLFVNPIFTHPLYLLTLLCAAGSASLLTTAWMGMR